MHLCLTMVQHFPGEHRPEDYLSPKHDWVQDKDEVTDPLRRCLYKPGKKRSHIWAGRTGRMGGI